MKVCIDLEASVDLTSSVIQKVGVCKNQAPNSRVLFFGHPQRELVAAQRCGFLAVQLCEAIRG